MTAAQALARAAGQLRAAGVPGPVRDARILLAHAADVDIARITLLGPEDLAAKTLTRFETLIARRVQREPVSHITGVRAFYGRRFHVSGDVLDPRPETETLVEAALAQPFSRVLDLGTGSGCILLSLLAECPDAMGVGVDLSAPACLQASANAQLHGLIERAQILQSNWFDAVQGHYDLIVSNPPYLAAGEMQRVAPELRNHEPRMALTDEADGLSAYRILAVQAPRYLSADGRLLLEIGWTQGEAVMDLFSMAGWGHVHCLSDLDGKDRVICARLA